MMAESTNPLGDTPAPGTPRYVWGVLCSDGVSRAGIGYPTKREAEMAATFAHTCPNNPHRVIRETLYVPVPEPTPDVIDCWKPRGWTHETRRANRRGGFVYWTVADITNIGPFVFARPVTVKGLGRWELVAVTTDPRGYIRMVANVGDVVPRRDRGKTGGVTE